MKTAKLLLTMVLLATASVAFANDYNYEFTAQDDVVIGEDAVPAPMADNYGGQSYGVMPSWANGCCERQPSKADHLWDNYCYEKNAGCNWGRGCCEKGFCGTGPFQKKCCDLPKLHMPKLNVWNKCRQKATCVKSAVKSCKPVCQKSVCQKPVCQKSVCQKPVCQKSCVKETKCKTVHCRRPLLSKLKLFRGCHGGKCGKGKGKGKGIDGTNVYYGDGVPAPAMEGSVIEGEIIEMPNEVPPAPPISDPAA